MRLLIDGYNLLHASGLMGRAIGPGALERARDRLVTQVAARLTEQERALTVIVFDARSAPPGASSEYTVDGLGIRFAVDYVSADEMLVELVRAHAAPESLTVVSSDHQVQVATSRRGATVIDSDRWWDKSKPIQETKSPSPRSSTPDVPVSHGTESRTGVPASAESTSAPAQRTPSPAEQRASAAKALEARMASSKPVDSSSKKARDARRAAPGSTPQQVSSSEPAVSKGKAPPPLGKPAAASRQAEVEQVEADDDFRFSSDEVNFWLSEFQQPKTDASQPRRVTPGARPTSAGSRPAPTMSPSAAADSTTSAETTDSASPVDATSKQDSPRSTGGRDKEAKATGGSDFDFPADYLKAIQQEIEGDDTP
ncbi:MAG: NYN domain-containing protein [Planctomycetales bacterium]|nr:NYN domain-containing protein [Planctomycetales bacterium]